MTFLNSFTHIK